MHKNHMLHKQSKAEQIWFGFNEANFISFV